MNIIFLIAMAMIPITIWYIKRKPDWLKDPDWVKEIREKLEAGAE